MNIERLQNEAYDLFHKSFYDDDKIRREEYFLRFIEMIYLYPEIEIRSRLERSVMYLFDSIFPNRHEEEHKRVYKILEKKFNL